MHARAENTGFLREFVLPELKAQILHARAQSIGFRRQFVHARAQSTGFLGEFVHESSTYKNTCLDSRRRRHMNFEHTIFSQRQLTLEQPDG